jgi:hypothetical protein
VLRSIFSKPFKYRAFPFGTVQSTQHGRDTAVSFFVLRLAQARPNLRCSHVAPNGRGGSRARRLLPVSSAFLDDIQAGIRNADVWSLKRQKQTGTSTLKWGWPERYRRKSSSCADQLMNSFRTSPTLRLNAPWNRWTCGITVAMPQLAVVTSTAGPV